jgi:hypothetical protein
MDGKLNKYIFVFAESTDSTDVQFNELKALLRLADPDLRISTVSVPRLEIARPASPKEAYIGKFRQACILNTYADRSLLYSVAKRGAYIHACGLLLAAKPMEAQSVKETSDAISRHLQAEGIKVCELSFYTEDAYGKDPGVRRGHLIDESRFFLQDLGFALAREALLENLAGQGVVPRGPDDGCQGRIWIFKDVLPAPPPLGSDWTYTEKDDEIYFLMYQPLYMVNNPLYALDQLNEAKPYWKGIDTTPQRLMGAMLNLAEVKKGEVVLEPFAYTGTLPLEAVRLDLSQVYYSDVFESIGANDNINALTDTVDKLEETIAEMRKIMSFEVLDQHQEILKVAQQSLFWDPHEAYPLEMRSVEGLMAECPSLRNFASRLFFYLVRRYFVDQRIGQTTSPDGKIAPHYGRREGYATPAEMGQALERRVTQWISLLEAYAESRRELGAERTRRGLTEIGYDPVSREKCVRLKGEVSQGVDLMADGIPLPNNSVHAIVTDPPYGYGSRAGPQQLHDLYERFFAEAFRVLGNGGRIAMCVLDKVRTGKHTEGELRTQAVVGLANDVARRQGVSFLAPALNPFTREERLLSFWKAKHKLNRGILSFQISK